MRAAIMQGRGEPLAVETVPDPAPGPDELLVRVQGCGICGSDLHIADRVDSPGRVLGHEFSGQVVATGSGVGGFAEGERVSVFPLVGCGQCLACLEGRVSRCASRQLVGGGLDGAYAEYVAVKARQAFRLPDAVDHRHGATVEPLSVALHAWERTEAEAGEAVLVLGGGPVGQAFALWASHFGAREVVLSDPVGHRRDLAAAAGATATIDPTAGDVAEAFAEIAGGPPTVVVECVGVAGMIQHAYDIAAPDGRVTVVGMCMTPDEIIPGVPFGKELRTQFVSFYRESDFDLTIKLLERGVVDPTPLITDVVDLDGLPGRFEALKHPTTECKVIIEP